MTVTPVRRLAERDAMLPDGTTPAGTRGRILEASLSLFAERGFAGTSIRAIGAETGINSATLYAHYASKEEILRELVDVGHVELRARLTEAVSGADTPIEKLAALVSAHVTAHATFTQLAIVTNTELHALSPELAVSAVATRAQLQELLVDVLESGAASGDFDLPDVALASNAIAGMGVHVATWFDTRGPRNADAVAAQYAEFALRLAGAK